MNQVAEKNEDMVDKKAFYKSFIPKDWEVKELGEVCSKPIVYGIVQAGEHIEDGIPYIRSTDVGNKISIDRLLRTSLSIAKKYSRSVVKPGDIVFSLRGNIGETSIVPSELSEANLTQGTARISPKANEVDNRFLRYCISTSVIHRHIIRVSKGSTFQEISLQELRKIKIPIPPIIEQRAITHILGRLDTAINSTGKLITQKELRKRWLMQQLLSGNKRLIGYDGEWKKCTGNDFLGQRKEQAPNDGNIPLFSLTIENGVTEKSERYEREFLVKDKNEKKYKIVFPNDIVFNPANLRWGAIAKHTRTFKVLLSPIYQVLPVKKGFDIDFVSYLVSSPRQIAYYASILEGTLIERMAVKVEPFLATKYQIPNLEEQTAIAQVLLAADKEISLLKTKAEKLHEQKKGLMQQLLTGKIRIK